MTRETLSKNAQAAIGAEIELSAALDALRIARIPFMVDGEPNTVDAQERLYYRASPAQRTALHTARARVTRARAACESAMAAWKANPHG